MSLTTKSPIRAATDSVLDDIRTQAVVNIRDGMEKIRPHYTLDVEKAYDQMLRRVVNRCARRTLDKSGKRIAFALPDQGIIVNINLCKDPELIKEVNRLMKRQLDGFKASVTRVEERLKVLTGQITMDEIIRQMEEENRTKEV